MAAFPTVDAKDLAHDFPVLRGKDVIVFDGVCVLCSGFMRFVVRHDRAQRFHFIIAQSALGEALYAALDLKQRDYETNLVLRDGKLFEKMDAFAEVMRILGWPWRALAIAGHLPILIKTWTYDRIARNRYAIFGRHDRCIAPSPELKSRFIG